MILVNGCSFSTSASLKEHVQDLIWPNLLASQLDMEVINFAKEGKSNRHICRELFTYLIWAKQEKKELLKDRPGTLGAYLASQGWKSLEEAIFYTRVRLYRTNSLYSWDMPSMEKYKDMEYKQAIENGWKMGMMFNDN